MKTQKKWVASESKLIYSDPWIRLRSDKITRPNGQKGSYGVIELKGGIGVVPLTSDNKIVIVGQYRYAPDVYSWEIPKGAFSTFGSEMSPIQVAKIELEEETGITAKKWNDLTMVRTLLGSTNDRVFLFLARDLKEGNPHPDKTEDIVINKVSIKEFYNMVKSQKITDSTSITAVALTEKFLKNQF